MVNNRVTRCFSIAKISHMMRRYALAAGFAGIRWQRLPSEVRLPAVPAGADAFIRAGWGCGPGNERRALYRLRAGIVFEYYARCPAYGAASREIVDWLILSSRATSDCVSPISRGRKASSRWNGVNLGRRPSLISFFPNANSSCFLTSH